MTGSLPFPSPSASYANRELAPLPSLAEAKRVGIDWETDLVPNHRRKGYGFSYYVDERCKGYVSLFHPESVNYDQSNVLAWMCTELRGKTIVCAEAKHEVAVTRNFGVSFEDLGCSVRDVFFPPALLDEKRRQINLDLISREELGQGKIELRGTDTWPIHERPAEDVAEYAVHDSRLAVMLDDAYQKKIDAEELNRVLDLENSIIFAVEEMERQGTFLDVELLMKWRAEVIAEHEQRIMAIYKETGLRINPSSSDDMGKLFRHLGLSTPLQTEKGQDSYTEEALLGFTHPIVTLALEGRQLASHEAKFLGKYVKAVEPDGRIRYRLNQLRRDEYGTITGRFSCGGGEHNINVQQVSVQKKQPKLLQRWPIRQLFVPPPGEVWFSSDASQIEFRIFSHYAQYVGSRRLIDAYKNDPNTDFYQMVADWTNLERDPDGKVISLCKLYGGGPKKVALLLHKSLIEGYDLCDRYDAEFPEAKMLLDMASRTAQNRGYIKTLYGRRGRYDVTQNEKFFTALNKILQGTAAEIMKIKIREIYQARKRLGFTARFPVHDEKNGSMKDPNMLGEANKLLNEQTSPLDVPIVWKSKIGKTWHEAH